MAKKLTNLFLLIPMMVFFAACSKTASLNNPCDVLVKITPSQSTAEYIVKNDRSFAQQVAMHKGRYEAFKCR